MRLTVETRVEFGVFLLAVLLIIVGFGMVWLPLGLLAAGFTLLLVLVDARRLRP